MSGFLGLTTVAESISGNLNLSKYHNKPDNKITPCFTQAKCVEVAHQGRPGSFIKTTLQVPGAKRNFVPQQLNTDFEASDSFLAHPAIVLGILSRLFSA